MLKISAFYLAKEKSFIPKENMILSQCRIKCNFYPSLFQDEIV
jgi:hypothetical protein